MPEGYIFPSMYVNVICFLFYLFDRKIRSFPLSGIPFFADRLKPVMVAKSSGNGVKGDVYIVLVMRALVS